MSFKATVFNVMIASPSDVPGERQAVREVLYEWNAIHADERKQILLPVGWETHSAPDMAGPPQSIINKQVLANCDLLVGIFWVRIGTATEDYASGAVEEIERHIASGKPTMLYFSEAPVHPDLVVDEQYKQLLKFKKDCRPRGLYQGFESIDGFKNKFRNQLHIILKQYFSRENEIANRELKQNSVIVQLTEDEQSLLKAASLDKGGIINRIKVAAGTFVETNGMHFIKSQTPREISKWDAILKSLVQRNYIKSVDYKGEVYEITAAGFDAADEI